MKYSRAWCAKAQWLPVNGQVFEPFLFGTAYAESELGAERELKALWAKICPVKPKWLAFIPGQIVFIEEQPSLKRAA